jgi:hypothetical protein
MHGENSPPFFKDGAQALAELLSNAERRVLEGQAHAVSMKALGPVLKQSFGSTTRGSRFG